MGFRFRRTIKIAPGVRLNLSKGGVSTSIGRRGATVNLSKRGSKATVGLPGTGLSYSTPTVPPGGSSRPSGPNPNNTAVGGCAALGLLGLLIVGITTCSIKSGPSASSTASPQVSTPAYVSARSLNCRASGDASAPIVQGLYHGEAVTVVDTNAGWSKIDLPSVSCWVSAAFLTDTRPDNGRSDAEATKMGLSSPVATGTGAVSTRGTVRNSRSNAGHAKRAWKRRRSAPVDFYGGSCPCSGSNVCIGPRGGRYCITSGGNKRYGV